LEKSTHHVVHGDYYVTIRKSYEGKVGGERLLGESKELLGVLHGERESRGDFKIGERIKPKSQYLDRLTADSVTQF
jgi:hypothetical protein